MISRKDMYTMLDMITDEPLKDEVKQKVVDEVGPLFIYSGASEQGTLWDQQLCPF